MTAREIVKQFIAEKGIDSLDLITEKTMCKPWPQLRKELAVRLLEAGFSTSKVGRTLGLHHSAIIMMVSPRREEKLARMREYSRLRRARAA